MVEVWAQYLLALLAGLVVGSFVTTLVYRLPRMQAAPNRYRPCEACVQRPAESPHNASSETAYGRRLNLWLPRSHCPLCLAPLAPLDLLPLLSWAILGGRCRHCGDRIAPLYPCIEAVLALLACLLVLVFGFGAQSLAGLVLLSGLLALSVIDIRTFTLPDVATLSLLWLGLLCNVMGLFTDLASAVIGAFLGYSVLWLLYQVHRLIRGVEGMGYGDFKLLAAIGAWLGWQELPGVVLAASASGLLWALWHWISHRIRTSRGGRQAHLDINLGMRIPFAPFLAFGSLVALLHPLPVS